MRDFLRENPECADKLLRHGVARLRDDDYSDEEIRAYLEDYLECSPLGSVDIDAILR